MTSYDVLETQDEHNMYDLSVGVSGVLNDEFEVYAKNINQVLCLPYNVCKRMGILHVRCSDGFCILCICTVNFEVRILLT